VSVSYLIVMSAKKGQSDEVFFFLPPLHVCRGTEIIVPGTFIWELV